MIAERGEWLAKMRRGIFCPGHSTGNRIGAWLNCRAILRSASRCNDQEIHCARQSELISVLLEPKGTTHEARFFLLPPFAAATNR